MSLKTPYAMWNPNAPFIIVALYNNQCRYLNAIAKVYEIKQLQDLMLFDAIIYNFDRHLGNFGAIIDNDTKRILRPALL